MNLWNESIDGNNFVMLILLKSELIKIYIPEGNVFPAYFMQGQLTSDSEISRTPVTVERQNGPKVG
jgi:hypothetical protein